MNPFAVKLSEYIQADGRTVARICRESGGKVRTVTLHAYKDGRRLPKDIGRVNVISSVLSLTIAKKEALNRCYRYALDIQNGKRLSVDGGVQ